MAKQGKKITNSKENSFLTKLKKEWEDRKPVLKFTMAFLGITLGVYGLSTFDLFYKVRQPLLYFYTYASSKVLNLFGYGTTAALDVLSNKDFSVDIQAGCDAVAPTILYIATILVFPIAWRVKWQGLLYGTLFLLAVNTFRIISLFMIGIHAKSIFDFMHLEVWQVIFIVITVVTWLYWYRWANKKLGIDA